MGSYAIFAILLLVVGLAVILAEVFIPSGGLLSCVVAVTLIASVTCAYFAWWKHNPAAFIGFCVVVLLAVPATVTGAFTLLPRTQFGQKILLEAPDADLVVPFARETARLAQLIGRTGVTQSLLNPGGMVIIDGERLHAFTDGLMLDPGVTVEVAEVRGTRLLVRVPTSSRPTSSAASPERPTLDFEFPPG